MLVRAWHLGAVICGAKTCYLGATYYSAHPRVYFCKKLQKEHICEIISRKRLNCKKKKSGRPATGRPWGPAARLPGGRFPGTCPQFVFLFFLQISPCHPAAGRPGPGSRAARSRPPGSGAAGVYFCKFPNQKYIFIKNGNKK